MNRLKVTLDHREQAYLETRAAADAQLAADGGQNSDSAYGKTHGKLARASCQSALPVVAREYLLYCRDTQANPSEQTHAVVEILSAFADKIENQFKIKTEAASAFGGQEERMRLFTEFLQEYRDTLDVVEEDMKRGRLNGELVCPYYRIPVRLFIRYEQAFIGGLLGATFTALIT